MAKAELIEPTKERLEENRCSIERFNEIRASVVIELPEARRRHPRNPANVDHSNKAG